MTALQRPSIAEFAASGPNPADHKHHVTRWVVTEELLRTKLVDNPSDAVIVDVGGESPLTVWLRALGYCARSTGDDDVRVGAFMALPNCLPASADVVLCCEVVEHLKDIGGSETNSERAQYVGSGVGRCLRATYATLKPGGALLLSTPNACGWIALMNVVRGEHPFMYKPHVREYAPKDVADMAQAAGFTVELLTTFDVWELHGLSDDDRNRIGGFLQRWGFQEDGLRGDDIFCIARKAQS